MLPHITRGCVPSDRCTAERVIELAMQAGFRRLPPIEWSALFERHDASLLIYRHPVLDAFNVRIGSDNAEEANRLISLLENETGIELQTGGGPV